MKNFILIRSYLTIWVGYFSIILILPVTYVNGEYYLSILCLLVFVAVSSSAFSVLYLLRPVKRNHGASYGIRGPKCLNLVIVSAVIFSILAVSFILYDRMFIQGIDYSKGISFAREQWRILGEARRGFSSVYSLIGNLLSGFPIVLASLLYLYYDKLTKKLRLLAFSTAVISVGVSTLLTGGRSIVMLFLVSLFLIGLLRKFRGARFRPDKMSRFVLVISGVTLIVSFAYAVYVFHLRALAGGDSSESYMLSMIEHLGGVYVGDNTNNSSLIDDILNYLIIVGGYLIHSVWTLQSIIDLSHYEGFVTFNFYRVNFSRVLGLDSSIGWEFSGLFSTYAGAFYHDYGVVGALTSSLAIGLMVFISTLILCCKNLNLLHIGAYLGMMYVVILSPLLLAVDIMSFPFIMIDFFMLYIIAVLSRVRLFTLPVGAS